jgi:hypothetical protein
VTAVAAYWHFSSSNTRATKQIASAQGPTGTLVAPIPTESSKVPAAPTVAESLKVEKKQELTEQSPALPLTPQEVAPKKQALGTPKPVVKEPTPRMKVPVAPPPAPKPDPSVVMLQNAQAAISSGHLLEPPNNNALYWALQARQNGNPQGAAVELRVTDAVFQQVQAQRAQKKYDGAITLLDELAQFYPGRRDIEQLRTAIVGEQQQWIVAQQNEARIKRFQVVHRHIITDNNFNVQKFYCVGILSIMPDGVVRYDCVQTNDPTGRCDKVAFAPGALKQVKAGPPEEAGLAHLHIGTHGQGNFDFYGKPQDIDNAFAALTPLVRH